MLVCLHANHWVSLYTDDATTVGLDGSIPPEIYALEALETLSISNEPVGGTLPERFGLEATNMRQLIIQGTKIEGTVPADYLSQSPLESFILGENNLSGSIPDDMGDADTLTEIDLGGNKFEGDIPDRL